MFSLPGCRVLPGGVGSREVNVLVSGTLGKAGEVLNLVKVDLAVAGDGFNDPEGIGLSIP